MLNIAREAVSMFIKALCLICASFVVFTGRSAFGVYYNCSYNSVNQQLSGKDFLSCAILCGQVEPCFLVEWSVPGIVGNKTCLSLIMLSYGEEFSSGNSKRRTMIRMVSINVLNCQLAEISCTNFNRMPALVLACYLTIVCVLEVNNLKKKRFSQHFTFSTLKELHKYAYNNC